MSETATASTKTLDPAEIESLRELTRGLMRKPIPPNHAEKLVQLGLAQPNPTGIRITTLGLAKIAMRRLPPFGP
jgi:hypothetical protein